MSRKKWRQARSRVKSLSAEYDAAQGRNRAPWYVRLGEWCFPGVLGAWQESRMKKHRDGLKRAVKKTSHTVKKITGRGRIYG